MCDWLRKFTISSVYTVVHASICTSVREDEPVLKEVIQNYDQVAKKLIDRFFIELLSSSLWRVTCVA